MPGLLTARKSASKFRTAYHVLQLWTAKDESSHAVVYGVRLEVHSCDVYARYVAALDAEHSNGQLAR
jgi:hypothetical protein